MQFFCIIGMVLAVIGVIIPVSTITRVTIRIYKYIHHPETKMANYNANNLNIYVCIETAAPSGGNNEQVHVLPCSPSVCLVLNHLFKIDCKYT